nr:reverse transcriptase domain-containing protein [Tanacetum cinerariifolium]
MEAQYGKFLDMIRVVRINVPLIDVLPRMPNYGKFLKEVINNKNKIEQISAAFLSDESSVILQNKVPAKLGDPESFLIPCNFNKAFSCNALADLGASINLMPIDIIDEILKEDFDAFLDEGSEILHSIEGTILEGKLFAEFDEFIAMTADENSKSESDTEEPPFEKITFNTDYKIKTSLEEPPTNLKLKPLPDNLEYVFLEEPFFLHVIISSQLSEENKNKLEFILKNHKKALLGKLQTFLESVHLFMHILPLNGKNVTSWLKKELCLDKRYQKQASKSIKKKINVISKPPPPINIKEAQALPINDDRVVITFLKKLFCRFGMPKALIGNRGTHFYNNIMEKTMKRYEINHRFSTSYHRQTSGQVENMNKALKRILKKTVKDNHAIWSRKLDDAL